MEPRLVPIAKIRVEAVPQLGGLLSFLTEPTVLLMACGSKGKYPSSGGQCTPESMGADGDGIQYFSSCSWQMSRKHLGSSAMRTIIPFMLKGVSPKGKRCLLSQYLPNCFSIHCLFAILCTKYQVKHKIQADELRHNLCSGGTSVGVSHPQFGGFIPGEFCVRCANTLSYDCACCKMGQQKKRCLERY